MSAVAIPIVPAIQLKRILYATDFSEASRAGLPVASALARRYNSQILAAHVWTPMPISLSTPEAYIALEKKEEDNAREAMTDFLNAPELAGLPVEVAVRSGIPADEMNRLVREKHPDLAIVSTHGRTGFSKLMMGSVAEEMCRNLVCPVLSIGPHLAPRFKTIREIKNIVFATDLSAQSAAVFPYLASLAHEYKATITLLHVLPAEAAGNPDLNVLAEPWLMELKKIYQSHLSPSSPAVFVVEAGDAVKRILAHAKEVNADLIGFGVRPASFLATHFRNTVTYKVMMQAECPVLMSHDGVR